MQKRKTFRPWQPEQTTLLPPSPRDWLSDGHQVYFLLDLVDELDLSEILIPALAKDPRGEKGFDPRMLTMLLLYAYCVGIVSSRKIERACYEDLTFRVLTGNQQPDHSRISEFRRRKLDALKGLFVQILRLCQKAGMVSLGHVALDGTKVQANASKHKAMSHERMLRAEKELEKEINALMRRAEILHAQEDRRFGKGKLGSELPDELRQGPGAAMLDGSRRFNAEKAYKDSKLCNLLMARQASQWLPVLAWSPGLVIPRGPGGFFRDSRSQNPLGQALYALAARDLLRLTETAERAGALLASLASGAVADPPGGFAYWSNRVLGPGQRVFELTEPSVEDQSDGLAATLWQLSAQQLLQVEVWATQQGK